MSLVPSAVESSSEAVRPRARRRSWAPWLVLGCYLVAAVVLTWRMWADPAGRSAVGDPGPADVDLLTWFLRFEATAVSHGHLPPLVTSALNAPLGINLMWNTSILLPGILLTPVTLLAGAQVSAAILQVAGFAGSAAALFFVLRRWGVSLPAAALGGAVYGFSPAIVDSGIALYQLHFVVLPPLLIDALLRLVTGRGRPLRTGAWLGVLTAAQLLTGEEVLALTGLAGVLLVLVLAASRPRLESARTRDAASGIAAAAVITVVICGYPLWVQFHGPLAEHGSPWPVDNFASTAREFVTPPGTLLFHTSASAASAAGSSAGLWEYLSYLGWPLIIVLVAAGIWFWRDLRVRATAVAWAVLELCALGGRTIRVGGLRYPGVLLPWHWLQGLPLLSQMLPVRLSVIADGAAAAALAFSLDLAWSPTRRAALSWRTKAIPAAVAALAVLPLVPLPAQTIQVTPVPAGWQAVFSKLDLASSATVLVVPVPYSHRPEAMRWQATTGDPGSLVGGWFIGPAPDGQAVVEYFGPPETTALAKYMDALWSGQRHPYPPTPQQTQAAIAYWRPAAVVAVTSPGSRLGQFLTGLFGPPGIRAGAVLAWRR